MSKSTYFAEHLRTAAASENAFVEILLQVKILEVLVHRMAACSSSTKFAKIKLFQNYFSEHLSMIVTALTNNYVNFSQPFFNNFSNFLW